MRNGQFYCVQIALERFPRFSRSTANDIVLEIWKELIIIIFHKILMHESLHGKLLANWMMKLKNQIAMFVLLLFHVGLPPDHH
mmetsp:Transcript_42378/g.128560  ORF Transcript_42378/g.128560 Transcript_42378/m.128560 type:complete len:83 (+) Transcript_42378:3801-4049(+)